MERAEASLALVAFGVILVVLFARIEHRSRFPSDSAEKARSSVVVNGGDFWHEYPVTKVDRVYDGDTFWLDWALGFDLEMCNVKCRLLGADAIEKRDPDGDAATSLTLQFMSRPNLLVRTLGRRDNFGRALVYVRDAETGDLLHEALIASGLTTGRFEN
jgi:endonuclease YncB( thermonuclease family)